MDSTVEMMKNAGAPINADQAKEIKQYLIASFPEIAAAEAGRDRRSGEGQIPYLGHADARLAPA